MEQNIKYLKYLDKVLNYLVSDCAHYTSKYETATTSIGGVKEFEPIYSTNFDKFLSVGFDRYLHENKSVLELDFALIFLRDQGYIFIDDFKNIQITYKGILKATYGFENEYSDKVEESERKSRQQNFENYWKVFSPIVGFILGLITALIT